MSFLTRVRKQVAVYWRKTGPDKYGKALYAAPVEIKCRWTDGIHTALSPKGDEFVSTSSVIVDRLMYLDDRLMLGPLESATPADPLSATTSFAVKAVDTIPNFRVTWFLYTVHL